MDSVRLMRALAKLSGPPTTASARAPVDPSSRLRVPEDFRVEFDLSRLRHLYYSGGRAGVCKVVCRGHARERVRRCELASERREREPF